MSAIFAELALVDGAWRRDVLLSIEGGVITAIEEGGSPADASDNAAILVPGMPNLHSHAFQRAMAGLAEVRGPAADSFWSWRTVMYRFALAMEPEDVEAVAAALYMDMLEAGFTRVGEFHYLHHGRDGAPYADIAELAARIVAASRTSGIGLTLLPVFYAYGGFGKAGPQPGQRRFINTLDSFADLMAACRKLVGGEPGATLGVAPHSLRAISPDELPALIALGERGPVHMHIAEQMREVEDCLAWSGARPVEWLLAHTPVDARWCLIHATHMTEAETIAMARSGATAGLCPITEANLGDGVFSAPSFLREGGCFGIGSDSNVSISVAHELRQLEYSQRLFHQARNVIAEPGGSTGRRLFDGAIAGGAAALGVRAGLSTGADADMVSLDAGRLAGATPDQILDRWIFGDGVAVDGVWTRGKRLVSGGRHCNHDAIRREFRSAMARLVECA
ncbi:formiminoglutamate deiminase [Kaistia soli DSM 19436]|uniref:Formiminoglutamate deiminase n=1 Tax=Kaistia soli DSM 19436 TaxID=1122133 RepID=A0A1M5DHV3_9HYPH|nr:formimidoylglutamate deiminase [Kaistia soli]SHF66578.1 formiminoglutamate deiminase [Kaistia soli DSM 19436]